MTLLEHVAVLLRTHDIPHALIGAAALAAAGIARSTYDLDLLTTDPRVLDAELWTPLMAEGTSVQRRRGDDDDPLAGVVRIESLGERPVDVIVGRHAWQAAAVARARPGPNGVSIVTPSDLVLLKLYAGGTQDVWDIRELLALPNRETLVAGVAATIHDLPRAARDLWATLQQ